MLFSICQFKIFKNTKKNYKINYIKPPNKLKEENDKIVPNDNKKNKPIKDSLKDIVRGLAKDSAKVLVRVLVRTTGVRTPP